MTHPASEMYARAHWFLYILQPRKFNLASERCVREARLKVYQMEPYSRTRCTRWEKDLFPPGWRDRVRISERIR